MISRALFHVPVLLQRFPVELSMCTNSNYIDHNKFNNTFDFEMPSSLLLVLSIVGLFVGVAARTSAQVTRDIAIAGLIIAGITFLMTCLMCMAGAGMGVLRMMKDRAPGHHDHHDQNDRSSRGVGSGSGSGSGSDGNSGIGVRAGNTL